MSLIDADTQRLCINLFSFSSVLFVSLHHFDNGSFYPYGGKGYHKQSGGPDARGRTVNIAWNDVSELISTFVVHLHVLNYNEITLIYPVEKKFWRFGNIGGTCCKFLEKSTNLHLFCLQ